MQIAGTIEHLASDAPLLIDRTITLVKQELPSYVAVPVAALQASVQRNLNIALRALRLGCAPSPGDVPEAEITVRERARQAVPVEDMMRAYRICIGVIQQRFLELAALDGVPPDAVLEGARLLWSVGDAFTTRVALAYQELSVEHALHDAQRRSDFLRSLLTGSLAETELASGCALYGLDAGAHYCAVRARGQTRAGVEVLRRRLEESGSAPNRPALVGVLGGDCAGVVVRRPMIQAELVVGIGAELPLADVAASFRTASRVLEVACRLHPAGVFGIEDMSWRLAAAADSEVGRHLAKRYLLPLRSLGEFGQQLEDTVRAYLANGLNVGRTAAELVVHVNTLRYRLQRFSEITGASLSSTEVIVELAWALELGALSEGRTTSSSPATGDIA